MESEKEPSPQQPRFAKSKWETVDENELEAQGKNPVHNNHASLNPSGRQWTKMS